jgi:hypothetical protein
VAILGFFGVRLNVSPMLMELEAAKRDVVKTYFIDLLKNCAILICDGQLQVKDRLCFSDAIFDEKMASRTHIGRLWNRIAPPRDRGSEWWRIWAS